MMTAKNKISNRFLGDGATGFTLIELLIVMAILGVLAVVVLVAINPVQQLARTRDAGRKSAVTQLGHAMEAYYTARGGTYVDETTTPAWITQLVSAGEMSSVPSAIAYTAGSATACTTNAENDYCYDSSDGAGTEPTVIFVTLESDSEISKCSAGTAYFVWSTADGRGGLVCSATAPAPGAQTWNAIQ